MHMVMVYMIQIQGTKTGDINIGQGKRISMIQVGRDLDENRLGHVISFVSFYMSVSFL